MKVERVSEGFYRAALIWHGVAKYSFGTTLKNAMENGYRLEAYFKVTDKAYERRRAALEDLMVEQDGSYFYEDALLRQRFRVPLNKEHASALTWYEEQKRKSDERADPWDAQF